MIKILTSGGATAAWYEYDAWGNVVSVGGNAYVANLNPIRYRGYYYDTETGFYYLNSRYYDPETCRFVNVDGYVSTGSALLGYNMFAYCLNNPISNVDSSGSIPMRSTIVCDGSGTPSTTPKNSATGSNMSQVGAICAVGSLLSAADGPLPIGDIAGIILIAGASVLISANSDVQAPSLSDEKDLSITKWPELKCAATFPVNPYEFNPIGLERCTYVQIGKGSNGGVIKWELPGTHIVIFEWNEDLRHFPHYHCLLPEWNNQHHDDHWIAGDIVPPPWQFLYF